MTQKYFLPSEVARLIMGYLKQEGYNKTFTCFLTECPHLREYLELVRSEQDYPTSLTLLGLTLTDILHEFARSKLQDMQGGNNCQQIQSLWTDFENISDKIKHHVCPQKPSVSNSGSHRIARRFHRRRPPAQFGLPQNTIASSNRSLSDERHNSHDCDTNNIRSHDQSNNDCNNQCESHCIPNQSRSGPLNRDNRFYVENIRNVNVSSKNIKNVTPCNCHIITRRMTNDPPRDGYRSHGNDDRTQPSHNLTSDDCIITSKYSPAKVTCRSLQFTEKSANDHSRESERGTELPVEMLPLPHVQSFTEFHRKTNLDNADSHMREHSDFNGQIDYNVTASTDVCGATTGDEIHNEIAWYTPYTPISSHPDVELSTPPSVFLDRGSSHLGTPKTCPTSERCLINDTDESDQVKSKHRSDIDNASVISIVTNEFSTRENIIQEDHITEFANSHTSMQPNTVHADENHSAFHDSPHFINNLDDQATSLSNQNQEMFAVDRSIVDLSDGKIVPSTPVKNPSAPADDSTSMRTPRRKRQQPRKRSFPLYHSNQWGETTAQSQANEIPSTNPTESGVPSIVEKLLEHSTIPEKLAEKINTQLLAPGITSQLSTLTQTFSLDDILNSNEVMSTNDVNQIIHQTQSDPDLDALFRIFETGFSSGDVGQSQQNLFTNDTQSSSAESCDSMLNKATHFELNAEIADGNSTIHGDTCRDGNSSNELNHFESSIKNSTINNIPNALHAKRPNQASTSTAPVLTEATAVMTTIQPDIETPSLTMPAITFPAKISTVDSTVLSFESQSRNDSIKSASKRKAPTAVPHNAAKHQKIDPTLSPMMKALIHAAKSWDDPSKPVDEIDVSEHITQKTVQQSRPSVPILPKTQDDSHKTIQELKTIPSDNIQPLVKHQVSNVEELLVQTQISGDDQHDIYEENQGHLIAIPEEPISDECTVLETNILTNEGPAQVLLNSDGVPAYLMLVNGTVVELVGDMQETVIQMVKVLVHGDEKTDKAISSKSITDKSVASKSVTDKSMTSINNLGRNICEDSHASNLEYRSDLHAAQDHILLNRDLAPDGGNRRIIRSSLAASSKKSVICSEQTPCIAESFKRSKIIMTQGRRRDAMKRKTVSVPFGLMTDQGVLSTIHLGQGEISGQGAKVSESHASTGEIDNQGSTVETSSKHPSDTHTAPTNKVVRIFGETITKTSPSKAMETVEQNVQSDVPRRGKGLSSKSVNRMPKARELGLIKAAGMANGAAEMKTVKGQKHCKDSLKHLQDCSMDSSKDVFKHGRVTRSVSKGLSPAQSGAMACNIDGNSGLPLCHNSSKTARSTDVESSSNKSGRSHRVSLTSSHTGDQVMESNKSAVKSPRCDKKVKSSRDQSMKSKVRKAKTKKDPLKDKSKNLKETKVVTRKCDNTKKSPSTVVEVNSNTCLKDNSPVTPRLSVRRKVLMSPEKLSGSQPDSIHHIDEHCVKENNVTLDSPNTRNEIAQALLYMANTPPKKRFLTSSETPTKTSVSRSSKFVHDCVNDMPDEIGLNDDTNASHSNSFTDRSSHDHTVIVDDISHPSNLGLTQVTSTNLTISNLSKGDLGKSAASNTSPLDLSVTKRPSVSPKKRPSISPKKRPSVSHKKRPSESFRVSPKKLIYHESLTPIKNTSDYVDSPITLHLDATPDKPYDRVPVLHSPHNGRVSSDTGQLSKVDRDTVTSQVSVNEETHRKTNVSIEVDSNNRLVDINNTVESTKIMNDGNSVENPDDRPIPENAARERSTDDISNINKPIVISGDVPDNSNEIWINENSINKTSIAACMIGKKTSEDKSEAGQMRTRKGDSTNNEHDSEDAPFHRTTGDTNNLPVLKSDGQLNNSLKVNEDDPSVMLNTNRLKSVHDTSTPDLNRSQFVISNDLSGQYRDDTLEEANENIQRDISFTQDMRTQDQSERLTVLSGSPANILNPVKSKKKSSKKRKNRSEIDLTTLDVDKFLAKLHK